MKKLILAALAAVAAFAFFASAAGLQVRANVLQVGQTTDLRCTETADVVAWGYNDNAEGGPISYAIVQLAADNVCDGETLHVTALGAAGNKLALGQIVIEDANRETNGTDTYRVAFPTQPRGDLVEGVRIGIDQGPGVRTLLP